MNSSQFKTTINCNNCIAKVTPYLNSVQGLVHWEVDTKNPEKILTVYGDNVDENTVKDKVREAGYTIERI